MTLISEFTMDYAPLTDQEIDSMFQEVYVPKMAPKYDGEKTAVYTIDNMNRLRLAEELYLVADLMDEFTRDENAAYAKVLETKNKIIHVLNQQIQRLDSEKSEYISRLNQMAAAVDEQSDILMGIVNEHVYQVGWDTNGIPFLLPVIIDLTADEELDNW